MADNIFAKSPVKIAQTRATERTRGVLEAMSSPKVPSVSTAPGGLDFDVLARQTQVPQNVLEAAHELSGLQGEDASAYAQNFAQSVAGQIQGGKSVGDAVKSILPEAAAQQILDHAIGLVQAPALEKAAPEAGDRNALADIGRRGASAVVKGVGHALEGMGRAFDGPNLDGRATLDESGQIKLVVTEREGESEMLANVKKSANKIRGAGDKIAAGISEEAQQKFRDSQFKGDLFKPSTWERPDGASLEGLAHMTVEVLGSMAPVVVASLVTRNPVAGATVGGSQAAGAGADQAREMIDEAANDVDEAGVSRLERESPYYRQLLAEGYDHPTAKRRVSEAAEQTAAAWSAVPGTIGGAATSRILQAPLQTLAAKGAAVRIGGTTAVSAAEEGSQEVAENIAAKHGVAKASGMEVDYTADTLNDFVMGAMGGAAVGAPAGAMNRVPSDPEPELPPVPEETSPAPDALPAPDVQEPAGPIGRAAALAPPPTEAPAPLATSSMVEGSKVALAIPGGNEIEAVFKSEDEGGMTFEQDGHPFYVTRDEIVAGKVNFRALTPLQAPQGADTGPTMPDTPVVSPFPDQVRFDVSTAITHEMQRAAANGKPMLGLDVSDRATQVAVSTGADAALAGATVAPSFGDPQLSEAARVGFELATNRASTAAEPASDVSLSRAAIPQGQAAKTNNSTKPRLKKRPFTDVVRHIGVDPNGPLGLELKHRGITPTSTPGLFKSGGAQNLDNLPAREFSEYADQIGRDDTGEYLSEDGIIEALAAEMAGNPVQDAQQSALQQQADQKVVLEELKARGLDLDDAGNEWIKPEMAEAERIIPPRSEFDDFTLGQDREDMIWGELREAERVLKWDLHATERRQVFDTLNEYGGSVEDALWSLLDKEPEEYAYAEPSHQAVQDPGPPLFEHEFSEYNGEEGSGAVSESAPGSESTAEGEGKSGTGPAAVESVAEPLQTPEPEPEPEPELERPTGFTFKLADRLEPSDQRALAKHRDNSTNVGRVISELDGVVRRAEAAMRRKGADVRQFDMSGKDADGNWNQEASIIGEAEVLARELIKAARSSNDKDVQMPAFDEGTGEYESDGTPMGYAMEWLTTVEGMGLPIDQVDESLDPDAAITETDPDTTFSDEEIFPKPDKTETLTPLAKKGPFTPQAQADAQLAKWKEVAADIGADGTNANKVVISLYDYTGAWSQPWQDAGYQVIRHDIKHGSDSIRNEAYILERIAEFRGAGLEIVGVLSACPCKTFAGSGARWWKERHDVKSPEALEQVFGPDAVYSGAKSALEYNVMLFEATQEVIRQAAPSRFHVLENPIGRIQEVTSLTKPSLKFHPSNFGDAYTKQTQLFGPMETDLPLNNVEPVDGSKVQSKLRGDDPLSKEARSTTPEGFAYAFFMANDPDARKRMGEKPETVSEQEPEQESAEFEHTSDGEQALIPGVAPVNDKARAESQMAKPKRGGDAPLPEGGLFDEGARAQTELFAESDNTPASEPVIENIRSRAAVLRGVPADQAPEVKGVSIKWDANENGFIFSRKHVDKVRAALQPNAKSIDAAPEPLPVEDARVAEKLRSAREDGKRAAKAGEPRKTKNWMGEEIAAEWLAGYSEGMVQAPSKSEFDAAASDANPNPTPAQAEAGNYQKGHIRWNGLDLAIETAKGEERRGTDPDGNEWSVTMPAHYGDLKRTEGADGDPLDFYMGDYPESNSVTIVNQVDPKTREFDEHKIVFGARNKSEALDIYRAGFSDGSGQSRIGSSSSTDVESFKGWLKDQDTTKPTETVQNAAKPNAKPISQAEWDAKPDDYKSVRDDGTLAWSELDDKTGGTVSRPVEIVQPGGDYGAKNKLVSKDRAVELRARLQAKLKNQINAGIDPEVMAIGAELAVFHIEAGARSFVDLAKAISDDLGTTQDRLKPYLRSWYNGARDMMEDHGQSVDGMDGADAVRAVLSSGVFDGTKPEKDTATVEKPAETAQIEEAQADLFAQAPAKEPRDDNGDHGSNDRAGAKESPPAAKAGADGELRAEPGERGRGGDRKPESARQRSEPATDGARDGDAGRSARSSERPRARNHVIPHGGLTLAKGEKTRARESVAAIKVLRELEATSQPATAEQRETLAKYGGAGTLAGALPRRDGSIRHPDLAAELDSLLSDDEKATLSRTSQYAFYTAESALRGMWRLAEQLGFKGGRVYEPGMGVGGFAGTMPDAVRDATKYEGLELDHVTAAIAQKLYPAHKIKQGDFIKSALPRNYYDLVIGNPPFAGTRIEADKDYPQRFMIHDYFFAKSMDAVRPGGLLMFITSAGTMNKLDNKARAYLADQADLIGAIRLPNTAFKENGTEVTTDIVVLRKRLDGEAEANPSWREADSTELPNGEGGTGYAAVNRYFNENPEMILGEQGLFDTLTASDRVGVRALPDSDLASDLRHLVAEKFPVDIMSEATDSVKLDAMDTDSAEKKTGSFYLSEDGTLHQFDGRVGQPVQKRGKGVKGGKTKKEIDVITQLIPIKDALRDVYAADIDGEGAAQARRDLNRAYDQFVQKNGPIGKQVRSFRRPSAVEMEGLRQQALQDARAAGTDFDIGSFDPSQLLEASEDSKPASLREIAAQRKQAMERPGYLEGDFNPDDVPDKVVVKRPNIDAFMDDPESFRLLAIEDYDEKSDTASKSRIFTESTVSKSSQPQIKSPEDALLYLLAETGRVDIDAISGMVDSDPVTVRAELGDKIFKNPANGDYETRTKYLSGNVRKKLDEALKAALGNPEYKINVSHLEEVQPDPVTSEEIRVPIGAHWFDAGIYTSFAESLGMKLKPEFNRQLGAWFVRGGDTSSAAARNEFGTPDKPFADLMALILNNKKIEIRRTDPQTKKTWVDDEATQLAKDKAKELQEKFTDWLWSDENRTAELEDTYNKAFNAEVAPVYDGGYLTTPGINSEWRWRPHQTAVIARILQSGSTYMAHTVGAGKTSAMIGAGMEARRLGLAQKPMYAVPNHMLVQFTSEFYHQYPLAKILVADEKRFHTSTRKQFIADAALGDWDAIIITHSAFEKIPPSEASVNTVVEELLSDIKSVLDDTPESGFGSGGQGEERAILGALGSMASILGLNVKSVTEDANSTRKKIEALIEAAEQRMSRQIDRRDQDQVFNFDELGVDMLFVDEAHLFRKLSFATTNGNIKGIDPAGSNKSMDLFVKSRALERINPGRGLVLASGTPITNTMAELYSISRYMQAGALKERGIAAFDAWASTFGSVESELEQLPDGGYKQIARFSKFVNTPELSLMVRQIMDVVTGADLEQYVTRPKLKGGKRSLVLVEAPGEVKDFQTKLAERMVAIANRKGPVKQGDDILLSVINDGRLSAIDMRLVDPLATGAGSKLEQMIQNIYRVWEKGAQSPLHGVKEGGGYTDAPIETGPTTQIVFSTLGVKPTKHNPSFSVHRFVKAELMRMGVPAADIILADDMKTHTLKQRAFNDMNEGKKRILIGSKTLFTGVNAQRRLKAVHNLDPLWFPADDEQRNGRAQRQGNMNPEIEIFDYSTKGTYDATMWQMMGRKAGFIEGFFRGDPTMREMEDLGEASQYQQATALSTRDPRVLELTEMRQKRDELDRRRSAIQSQKNRLGNEIRNKTRRAGLLEEERKQWQQAATRVVELKGDKFAGSVEGTTFTDRSEFGQAIIDIAKDVDAGSKRVQHRKVGEISGFPLLYSFSPASGTHYLDVQVFGDMTIDLGFSFDPVGLARRTEGGVSRIPKAEIDIEIQIADLEAAVSAAREQLGKVKDFDQLQELRLLEEQVDDLESELEAEAQPETDGKTKVSEDQDASQPNADVRALAKSLNEELARFGLSGKVKGSVWRNLKAGPLALDGLYHAGEIKLSAAATDSVRNVARHEIIHALRDESFWGKPYGLFSQGEWRALVRAARKDKAVMKQVHALYPDLSGAALIEEAIAERYRVWGQKRDAGGPGATLFERISNALSALSNALKGNGLVSAANVFERMERGDFGGRGGPSPTGPKKPPRQKRQSKIAAAVKSARTEKELLSDLLTQAMAGKNGANLLALVPGRALMTELGAKMPSVNKYLRFKEQMDALRNHMHAETDELAQRWRKLINKDRKANVSMMELMHDSTIEGQDPSMPFMPVAEPRDSMLVEKYGRDSKTGAEAAKRIEEDARRIPIYDEMRERFEMLPKAFQDMFVEVRDTYDALGQKFEKAIEENAEKAMSIAVRRAERAHEKRLDEIRDDGLTGKERADAIAAADAELATAKMMNQWSKNARINALRQRFESNKLEGPYFPLARFGDFYVTLRDEDGKVVSFSRFEKARDQRKFAGEMRGQWDVETGVISEMQARQTVDPGFVADVEALLDEIDADHQVMDAVWQRWLQTLPDMSMRKSRLHRKGTPGYTEDAFRAFGSHMFHGAHQLARLKYSLDMGEAIDVAEKDARDSSNPERNGLIVKELSRRHEYVMNPSGSAWAQTLTGAAFVYYLSMTPAAAIVNLTQTTVVGIPVLGAYWGKGGQRRAAAELTKAMQDFTRGRGHAMHSRRLTQNERLALQEAYDRGTIDKSQAHDLAGVGETGVEYSPVRTKVMGAISWFFHHAERTNREITFLAAYRMAKKRGKSHDAAVRKAADLTWKSHFDYQNTSRPRLMQNDAMRVLMVFRNFQINMLWRLFRDTHQVLNGESAEVRAEARRQLLGISAQMMLQAGVKGTWAYSILKMLTGLFFAGGGDEAEQEMEKALLAVLPRDAVGALLNGVPGHLLGIDLRSRIGMPDLWFRAPDRQLEGEDEYNYWVQQFLGAVPGIAQNLHRGANQVAEGHVWRGVETMVPKAIRDLMRSGRYFWEGARTYNGDDIVDEFTTKELVAQAIGFTPARLSERYDANTRLKNAEQRILDERKAIMKEIGNSVLDGGGMTDAMRRKVKAFNDKNPDYPIDNKSLRRSIRSRQQASANNEFGVQLNQKLNSRLRKDAAPLLYER